jgi:gamma-glutamyltranspeptidase/glutathione hydrolase
MRNFDLAGRSPVHSLNGMVATSHPLSTVTGLDVLRSGGNAMDAAIAACAVQCVVEPQSTGIGGDCFALIAPEGSDRIVGFNGSGRAPAAATPEWYAGQGIGEIERQTPHAVTVPGAIDAWVQLLSDYGTRSLGDLLRPAIGFARNGYPVHGRVALDWNLNADILAKAPSTAAIFLPGGKVPAAGSIHRQPGLADTLERIADGGRDAFYTGPVAEDIVAYLQGLGGLHSMADFAAAKGEYVDPIKIDYHGYQVYECPPNGQGVTALELVNILSTLGLGDLEPLSVARLHLQIEAAKLAYADRDAVLADPAQSPVPVQQLVSMDHARQRAAEIRGDAAVKAPPSAFPAHRDTVYLCVVDRDRNAVSFINSLFNGFGSGLMAPGTGVLLQNRGCGFVVEPGHPNCIAPAKRPLHTLIPGMLAREGRAVMPFGVMGGHFQAMGHAHFLTNLFEFGMDLQEAVDLPRVFPNQKGTVEVESGVPEAVVEGLERLGHEIVKAEKPIGGGQAISIDWEQGVLTGASDPRKDGLALGY